MVQFYDLADITLGTPTISGHEVYIGASYKSSADPDAKAKSVIYKKNKHGQAKYSRFEVAFSRLAQLFLDKDTTAPQKLVMNNKKNIMGVATENLCYVIDRKEGASAQFYSLKNPSQDCTFSATVTSNPEDIPFYFFNQVPHGFFNQLIQAEKDNQWTIDYASLASLMSSSYTLEEDDLHKGNFGFYLVEHEGKPRVVFFKIDHDLMWADSIISFKKMRLAHVFNGINAFQITEKDLLEFPKLSHSLNIYWPTRFNVFIKPKDSKAYLDLDDIKSFENLAKEPEFVRSKWLSFYKHILIPEAVLKSSLTECLDEQDPSDRAIIALLTSAVVARQARLRAVLFSIKEFRDCIATITKEEQQRLGLDPDFKIHDLSAFEEGDTPLHTAIRLGDYRYQETIQRFGDYIHVKNKAGQTPLDVAAAMLSEQEPSSDLRKDLRFTIQHLLTEGAEKNQQFEQIYNQYEIASYSPTIPYISSADKAKNYTELKNILSSIGEDHSLCLKYKKNLAIACVTRFIENNEKNPNLAGILKKLKQDLNGTSPKSEHAPLLYIRQLRSNLWFIRMIRGLYGSSSTLCELNALIDTKLIEVSVQSYTNYLFFTPQASPDEAINPQSAPPDPKV